MRVTMGVLGLALAILQAPGGADADVAALVQQLRHPNPGVRGMAAEKLGEMGPAARAAVKPLAAALADEDLNVRYWAARALGEMAEQAGPAVPALVGALRTTLPGRGLQGPMRYYADVRAVSAEALGRIGAAARMALPALKEALDDGDQSVREAAAEAVKRIEGADKQGGRK
jgi:HEAT repeat protein